MGVVLPPIDCVRLSISLDRKLISNMSSGNSELYLMNQLLNQCFGVLSVELQKPPTNTIPSTFCAPVVHRPSPPMQINKIPRNRKTMVFKRRQTHLNANTARRVIISSKKRQAICQLQTSTEAGVHQTVKDEPRRLGTEKELEPSLKTTPRIITLPRMPEAKLSSKQSDNQANYTTAIQHSHNTLNGLQQDINSSITLSNMNLPVEMGSIYNGTSCKEIKIEPVETTDEKSHCELKLPLNDRSENTFVSTMMSSNDEEANETSSERAKMSTVLSDSILSEYGQTDYELELMRNVFERGLKDSLTIVPRAENQKEKFTRFSKSFNCRLYEIAPIGCFEDFVKFNLMLQDYKKYSQLEEDLKTFIAKLNKEDSVRMILNYVMHPWLQDEFSFTGRKHAGENEGKRTFRETPFYAFIEREVLRNGIYNSGEIPEFQRKIKNHLTQIYRKAKKIDKNYEPFAVRIASAELKAKRKASYAKRKMNRRRTNILEDYILSDGQSQNMMRMRNYSTSNSCRSPSSTEENSNELSCVTNNIENKLNGFQTENLSVITLDNSQDMTSLASRVLYNENPRPPSLIQEITTPSILHSNLIMDHNNPSHIKQEDSIDLFSDQT